jgi:uncharacterized membrane protein YeaQ/YmgE (transglycosylase-associated protein family)
MGIIGTIISGLIIGVIAKMFVHGPGEPQGFILTAILGIVGAFVGQYIGGALHIGTEGGLMWWVMSVVGAVIVLVIWGAVVKRTA